MENEKRRPLTAGEQRAARKLKDAWQKCKRKDKGITQEHIAGELEVTQGTVSHYMNGQIPLNFETLLKFATILKFNPSDIYPEIIPYNMRLFIKQGFMERSAENMESLRIAEDIESLPSDQRAALRVYLQALVNKNEDTPDTGTN